MLCDLRGPLNDALDKLSGAEGGIWLEAFKRFLRRENPWPRPVRILLGQFRDADAVRATFKVAGCNLGGWANDLLGRMQFSDQLRAMNLVPVRDTDLRFSDPYRTQEFLTVAERSGYVICPPEAGPAARLVYADQSEKSRMPIGMEPIKSRDGVERVFVLDGSSRGEACLNADRSYSQGTHWPVGTYWLLGSREPVTPGLIPRTY